VLFATFVRRTAPVLQKRSVSRVSRVSAGPAFFPASPLPLLWHSPLLAPPQQATRPPRSWSAGRVSTFLVRCFLRSCRSPAAVRPALPAPVFISASRRCFPYSPPYPPCRSFSTRRVNRAPRSVLSSKNPAFLMFFFFPTSTPPRPRWVTKL